ncbi:hypothetical protein HI914_00942 [Erysiphe necator]|nr:hypothetical protein HI914_00942 [Erysiphe necator]
MEEHIVSVDYDKTLLKFRGQEIKVKAKTCDALTMDCVLSNLPSFTRNTAGLTVVFAASNNDTE